ncbi:MAG: membrane protein insertase YidC [Actinomycetaceae bacterium]|nr:membrane protein insertase YidC [Actinomycetaceae bacterium]
MGWYDTVLFPFKWLTAWIMYGVHEGLTSIGFADGPGLAWVLAIVGLTIVIRVLIWPLYIKQIKSSRAGQVIQPEMTAIRNKYKGRKDTVSQQQMQQEMMALYKKHNFSPMASCWPILVQLPIFAALFRMLWAMKDVAAGKYAFPSIGPIGAKLASDIEHSMLFGAPLSTSMVNSTDWSTKVVALVLIIFMMVTQFLTMRQLTMKNMPASALSGDNPMARMNKSMMYTMPLIMAFSGWALQIGVLVYWATTNLFTTFQQAWAIWRMPTPGSTAHDRLVAKNKVKYAALKEQRDAVYLAELETLGVTDQEVKNAAAKIAKAGADADVSDVLGNEEKAEALKAGVEKRAKLQEELQNLRIKMHLEIAKPKPRTRETFTEKILRKADEQNRLQQQAQRVSGPVRSERWQPSRKKSKAQRKAEAAKRREAARKSDKFGMSQDEIERRRAQRQRDARAARKKNRKRK